MPERALPDPGDVATAYDRWAASYDSDRNATRDLDAHVVRRTLVGLEGAAVLELGCGTGKNTGWLAEHARRVVAVDFSPGMLAVARSRVAATNVAFVHHDISAPWPVGDQAIDVVIANLVLEHVRDVAPVFTEAARVIRPGGRFLLCELHPYRQLAGGQAHFTDASTGEMVRVPAFVHTVAEYVNGALSAGFALRALGEWLEPGAPEAAPPRLLSVLLER